MRGSLSRSRRTFRRALEIVGGKADGVIVVVYEDYSSVRAAAMWLWLHARTLELITLELQILAVDLLAATVSAVA